MNPQFVAPGSNDFDVSALDGDTQIAQAGTVRVLTVADWPLARLTPEAASNLGNLKQLRRLELAGTHIPSQRLDAGGIDQLATESRVERLSVHGAALPASVLRDVLTRCAALTELDIRGLDLSDADLDAITMAQPGLAALSVGYTTQDRGPHQYHPGRLTARVGEILGKLHRLRTVRLRGLPVSDASLLAFPRALQRLEELDCGATAIGDGLARQLADSPRLARVCLDRTKVSDAGVAALAQAPGLSEVVLSWSQVSGEGANALLRQRHLSRLGLAGVDLSALTLPPAAESLRNLDLAFTGPSDALLADVAGLPLLENLGLAGAKVTARGIASLAEASLRELDLGRIPLGDESLAIIARMPHLQKLQLQLVTAGGWGKIAGIEAELELLAPPPPPTTPLPGSLKKLRLQGKLDRDAAKKLGHLPHLDTLSIFAGAEHLAETGPDDFPQLRTLNAEQSGLDDVTLDILGRLPNLEALFISDNPIGSSVIRLAGPFLHTLELRGTEVDDRAIDALALLPRLHCLDLPGTRVTPEAIAALVPAARNLQSLALDGRQLTPQTATVLAASPLLFELYLYGREVNDERFSLLRACQNLRELNLNGTDLGDASVKVLIDMRGLRTIRIDQNPLSAAAVALIRSTRPEIQLQIFQVGFANSGRGGTAGSGH